MKKINKKIIIIILIITIIIGTTIYEKIIKDRNLIEINEDIDITNTNEENTTEEQNTTNSESNSKIIIYITGQVRKEGVYELDENSRITDAIEMAGGLKEEANIENINLAEILEDGTKIYIPNKKENNKQTENINLIQKNTGNTTEISKKNNTENKQNQNTKININTATQTELETLPGIGPSTALKIVNYRKDNGKFKNIEDIKNVSGIGDSKFNNIKNLIKV